MILHDTIDIQKREDANRCSSYVELVVPNYNFNEFRQKYSCRQTPHCSTTSVTAAISIKNKLIFGPVHVSI
jgi:hypothetical protein